MIFLLDDDFESAIYSNKGTLLVVQYCFMLFYCCLDVYLFCLMLFYVAVMLFSAVSTLQYCSPQPHTQLASMSEMTSDQTGGYLSYQQSHTQHY